MRPESGFGIAPNCLKIGNDVTIFWHVVMITIFEAVLFLLSSLVTEQIFMSVSSLVLEL